MSDEQWNWTDRYEQRTPSSDLMQGDIIRVEEGASFKENYSRSELFIILNQSCDLARQQVLDKTIPNKVSRMRTALISPIVSVATFIQHWSRSKKNKLATSQKLERIIMWNDSLAVYLPPSNKVDFEDEANPVVPWDAIVVLEEIYSLELWHLETDSETSPDEPPSPPVPDLSGYEALLKLKRIGLASPWAERVGWMCGELFARVGTPDSDPATLKTMQQEIANRILPPAQ